MKLLFKLKGQPNEGYMIIAHTDHKNRIYEYSDMDRGLHRMKQKPTIAYWKFRKDMNKRGFILIKETPE